MMGIAQKLFVQRSFKSLLSSELKFQHWPMLEKMLEAKRLGYVDYSLAMQLLNSIPDESIAAFICHLSLSARQGHICVKIENGIIKPSPADIWISEEIEEGCEKKDFFEDEVLIQLILLGEKKIVSPLIHHVNEDISFINAPIIHHRTSYYLQRSWLLETSCLNSLKKQFLNNYTLFPIDVDSIQSKVRFLVEQGKLLEEQAAAILKACFAPLTLITGGPGTGKTYTAGILIRMIWDNLPMDLRSSFKIALGAPTGKAAANLEGSIQQALKGVEGFLIVKAQTLHQLLGIKKHSPVKKTITLAADLILIDESSMIDIHMMSQLLSSIKPGARLILLGDRNQLPSVEGGSLFADLTTYFLSDSEKQAQVAEFKKCMRTELWTIIDLADNIKRGNSVEAFNLLGSKKKGLSFVELDDVLKVSEYQKRLFDYVIPKFDLSSIADNLQETMELFSRFRILTPMRKGPFGVDAMNAQIFKSLSMKKSHLENLIVPIMVTQNDYSYGLFNGEVGLLIKNRDTEICVFSPRDQTQKIRIIPKLLMPRFEFAYCISVHKSQGSEFNHVLLLLPDGTQTFGREALYTGVTRAKQHLEIWSRREILTQMIETEGLRQSGFVERLST